MGASTEQIDRTTFAIQNACAEIEALMQDESSRALSLALTNCQQAAMWHGWHEGEQGRGVSPMPSPHDVGDEQFIVKPVGSVGTNFAATTATMLPEVDIKAILPPPMPPAPPGVAVTSPLTDALSILENAKTI